MSLSVNKVPVVGFAAWSGTGKTTLIARILPLLRERDLRVGVVKHAHHTFDIDYPGKDSYELRKAGASQMLVGSRQRWALICETPEAEDEPALAELMDRLLTDELDLILVEGFKPENMPKIELHRPSLGKPLLFPKDSSVIALCTDEPIERDVPLPTFDLNQPTQIADFLLATVLDAPA